jgi:hypothetical protein
MLIVPMNARGVPITGKHEEAEFRHEVSKNRVGFDRSSEKFLRRWIAGDHWRCLTHEMWLWVLLAALH